jgi:hypothetical protein
MEVVWLFETFLGICFVAFEKEMLSCYSLC